MLIVSLLFAFCVGLAVCGDIQDFDDTEEGYEFIYHDANDLLMVKHEDSCYFVHLPDKTESLLQNDHRLSHYITSPLKRTEHSLLAHLMNNRSGDVIESSLAAMRDKYQDRLADFECLDKRIFEVKTSSSSHSSSLFVVTQRPAHHQHGTHHPPTTAKSHSGSGVQNLCQLLSTGLHAYPGQCQKFVVCLGGHSSVEECADGTIFSSTSGGCIYSGAASDCTLVTHRPAHQQHGTHHPPTTTKSHSGSGVQNICRHLSTGLHPYPYPGQCQKFVVCTGGLTFVQECADGTVFSSTSGGCIYSGAASDC